MTREESQNKSIEIVRSTLQEVALKCGKFSFTQRKGKKFEGFNLYYDDEPLSELWAFVGDDIERFHFYTNYVSETDKAEAVEIKKGGSKDKFLSNHNGKKVYNYHPRFEYKWKWEARDRSELLSEIDREIRICSGERLNIGVGINNPIPPQYIETKDGIISVTCPTCGYVFSKAERCPECGQLIDYAY